MSTKEPRENKNAPFTALFRFEQSAEGSADSLLEWCSLVCKKTGGCVFFTIRHEEDASLCLGCNGFPTDYSLHAQSYSQSAVVRQLELRVSAPDPSGSAAWLKFELTPYVIDDMQDLHAELVVYWDECEMPTSRAARVSYCFPGIEDWGWVQTRARAFATPPLRDKTKTWTQKKT